MYCYNCGKQLPDGSAFCAFCRARLADEPGAGGEKPRKKVGTAGGDKAPFHKKRYLVPLIIGVISVLIIASLVVFVIVPILNGEEIFAVGSRDGERRSLEEEYTAEEPEYSEDAGREATPPRRPWRWPAPPPG